VRSSPSALAEGDDYRNFNWSQFGVISDEKNWPISFQILKHSLNKEGAMNSSNYRRAVGIFADYQATEQALRELKDIGYGMEHVSVIGQHSDHLNRFGSVNEVHVPDLHAGNDNHGDDGAKTGVITGGTVGGLTGLLVGLGTLAIPGVGPIMLAGTTATAIATAAAGGAIGAATGGILGGLVGLGIPEDRAKVYNDSVLQGKYLCIVDGTDHDIDRAAPILKHRGIHEWDVYPLEDRSTATSLLRLFT